MGGLDRANNWWTLCILRNLITAYLQYCRRSFYSIHYLSSSTQATSSAYWCKWKRANMFLPTSLKRYYVMNFGVAIAASKTAIFWMRTQNTGKYITNTNRYRQIHDLLLTSKIIQLRIVRPSSTLVSSIFHVLHRALTPEDSCFYINNPAQNSILNRKHLKSFICSSD